ncbi:MAG: redoxin domain-containing protein, partial [Myxococcota bacterium]
MGLLDSLLGSGTGLTAGAKAPDFSLEDQNGRRVSSAELRGRNVVVYFYPKDDTPG